MNKTSYGESAEAGSLTFYGSKIMGKSYKRPELLAPAGSFDSLRAAINAGADAVYMGGSKFGARAYADNPDEKGMLECIEFCHLRNRKIYLTVNTLLKERELEDELYNYLKPFYEAGIDAVIVQDPGVMEYISTHFPGLDIHVSTQASITMAEGIKGITGLLSRPQSVTRVVPARELSMAELKRMRKSTELEMEVFVHGALCCCYSGQCLMSSLAGGRSGNRGRCAQPCRKLYETAVEDKTYNGYFLSPKDMCTIDILQELIEAGIDSFKIEGRMKSPEYAAGVVAVYRDFIDRYCAENRAGSSLKDMSGQEEADNFNSLNKKDLSEIYNRGGFSEGYLKAHNGQEMMSTFRPGHYGVKVGEVTRTEGRKAFIKTYTDVMIGDVLEIRDSVTGRSIYEFTLGENYNGGTGFNILTMKDRLAVKGQYVFRTKNKHLLENIDKLYVDRDIKVPVNIYVNARLNEPLSMKMEVFDREFSTESKGQPVQKALNSEISAEALQSQSSKLGNTDFYAKNIKVTADKGIFVPVQDIKRLKRECAEKLKEEIKKAYARKALNASDMTQVKKADDDYGRKLQALNSDNESYTVSVRNTEQLKAVLDTDRAGCIGCIYLDMASFEETKESKDLSGFLEYGTDLVLAKGKRAYIKLPRILRSKYYDEIKELCLKFKDKTGFIASNYEELTILKNIGAVYRTDHNLYCFNNTAKERFGTEYTLPIELNEAEMKNVADSSGEFIIYGLLPVMVTAQCAYKTVTGKCGPHKDIYLKDQKGYIFRTHSVCGYCYNLIYNSAVLCLLHRMDNIRKIGCGSFRLEFTFEDASETALIIRVLNMAVKGGACETPELIMDLPLTNGHFNRGVE